MTDLEEHFKKMADNHIRYSLHRARDGSVVITSINREQHKYDACFTPSGQKIDL